MNDKSIEELVKLVYALGSNHLIAYLFVAIVLVVLIYLVLGFIKFILGRKDNMFLINKLMEIQKESIGVIAESKKVIDRNTTYLEILIQRNNIK